MIFDAGARQVHCDQASFDVVDVFECRGEILRQNGRGEAEANFIGEANGIIVIVGADEREDRSEDFFLRDGGVGRNVAEDGWLNEVAFRERSFGEAIAAGEKIAAFALTFFDIAENGFELRFIGARAHVDAGLGAGADFKRGGFFDQLRDERVVDGRFDDGAAGGGALLAGGGEGCVHYGVHGVIEIGIFENDGGILAAHFKLRGEFARGDGVVDVIADPQEPVKEMARIAEWLTNVSPISRLEPVTTLRTPFGSPASTSASARRKVHDGASAAGLITTVLPQISAGAIFHAGMAMGKFHGVMRGDAATGLRIVKAEDAIAFGGGTVSPVKARCLLRPKSGYETEDVDGAT